MQRIIHYLFVLLLLGNLSCSSGIKSDEQEASAEQIPATASPLLSERKIIREANIRFQVKDLSESSRKVESLIEKYNAVLTNSQSYNQRESIEASYTIKVAPEKLYALLTVIQKESIYLDIKTVKADDVTLQLVDVEARIKAKQAVKQKYLALLEKTTKVQEILAIETELQKVQEELESVQAQMKVLQQQTRFSTINLTIYQLVPASYSDRTGFSTRVVSALSGGWHLFKDMIIGLMYLWPLLILGIMVTLAIRWQKNKRKSTL